MSISLGDHILDSLTDEFLSVVKGQDNAEKPDGDDRNADAFNSLPDELKEFFFGFGR